MASPIGRYTFDDNGGQLTTITDTSGNNNNGTFTGSGTTSVSGKSNLALSFTGSGNGDFGTSGVLVNASMSITMWINGASQSNVGFFGNLSGTTGMVFLDDFFGPLGVQYYDSGNNFNGFRGSATTPLDSTFHHIALTLGPAGVFFYIDGSQDSNPSSTAVTMAASTAHTLLAGYPSGGSFNGIIDEVRIYNVQLSGSDILAIFNDPGGQLPGGGFQPYDPYRNSPNLAAILAQKRKPMVGWCESYDHRFRSRKSGLIVPSRQLILP